MNIHIETYHIKPTINCTQCDKLFASQRVLQKHMKNTHSEKPTCNICGKQVRKIKSHMILVHKSDEEKKYQCSKCGKGFLTQRALDIHDMNVHLKLRPYECRYGCESRYNDPSNRSAHERKTHGKNFNKA